MSTLGFAAQGPQSFTLDGYIKQAGTSTALKDAALKIKIQIMDPTKQCLLYEEEQTVDTVSSEGYFSIQVGSDIGAAKRTADDSGLAMYQVFQNSTAVVAKDVPGQTCTGGTFTPITQDYRYMRVTVTPSGTGVADELSPDTMMDAVPAAVIAEWAESIGGFTPNDLLQVNAGDNLTQTNLENLFAGTGLSNLQAIAAGNFMPKSSTAGATLPSYATATPPTTPVAGSMWYDSGTKEVKYFDGSTTQIVGTGGGSVTEVKTTTNLTVDGVAGGTITSSGTLDLNNTGVTASTYPKVTVDAKGRVTAGTTLAETDIPTLTTAGKVSGDTITSGTIGGNTAINTTGNITTTGTITAPTFSSTAMSTRQLDIYDSDNTQYVRLVTPATADLTTSYALTLPTGDGDANQVLTTDGAGVLTWTTPITGSTGYVNGGNSFGADASVGLKDNFRLDIKTNDTPRITVTADGKVGIGTTAPGATLEVSHSGSAAEMTLTDDDTETSLNFKSTSNTTTGTRLGKIDFIGHNGTGDYVAARISSVVSGATGSTIPSELKFSAARSGVPYSESNDTVMRMQAGGVQSATSAFRSSPVVMGSADAPVPICLNMFSSPCEGATILSHVSGALENSNNLDIINASGTASTAMSLRGLAAASGYYPKLWIANSRNGSFVMSGDRLGQLEFQGGAFKISGGTLEATSGYQAALIAAEIDGSTGSATSMPGRLIFSTTPSASIASQERMRIDSTGKTGIGTTDPKTLLEVAGTVKVGDGGETCATDYAGGIRYNTGNLQFCNGTAWSTLGVAGSGITALTGDVTTTGSGSVTATIANDAVTSAKIKDGEIATADLANDAVTFAKFQNIKTERLLGRTGLTDGDMQEIEMGTGLTLSGGVLLLDDTTDDDTLSGLSCAANEVPKWNGSAWICQSTASTSTSGALVLRDGTGNFAANNITANGLSINNAGSLVNIASPVGANYSLTLPADDGDANQVLTTDGAGVLTWTDALTDSTGYKNGGNSFSADATIGLNDGHRLDIETNNTPRMTVMADGKVGVGTTAPPTIFAVKETGTSSSANTNINIWNTAPMIYKDYTYSPSAASGIQVTADASYMLVTGANHTGIASGNMAVVDWKGTSAPNSIYGYYGQAFMNGSGSGGTVAGLRGFATQLGSGSVVGTAGVSGSAYNQSATGGSVSQVAGGSFQATQQAGTTLELVGVAAKAGIVLGQTVNNRAMGLYTTVENAGTVPVSYGLYIDSIQGTKAYSLYASDATAPSYFAGKVGIGTTNPSASLEVKDPTSARLLVANVDPASNPGSEIRLENYRKSWGAGDPAIISYVARGTAAAPQPVTNGLKILSLQGRGYAESGFGADRDGARIDFIAANDWGNSNVRTNMIFSTAGPDSAWSAIERMRIAADGKVGIGVTNPGYALDVAGDINVTGNFKVNGVNIPTTSGGGDFKSDGTVAMTGPLLAATGGTSSSLTGGLVFGDGDTAIYEPSDDSLNFALAGTNRWFMNQTSFYSTTGTGPSISVNSGGPNFKPRYSYEAGLGQVENGVISLMTDGQHRLVIDASGNVGIGTTEPTGKFSVVSPDDFGGIQLQSGDAAKFTAFSIGRTSKEGYLGIAAGTDQFVLGAVAGDVILRNNSGKIMLAVNNGATAALTATNAGRVGIGTTAPSAPLEVGYIGGTGGIVVTGSSGSEITALKLVNTATNSGSGASILLNSSSSTAAAISGIRGPLSTDGVLILKTRNLADGVTERLRIDQNGNVGIGTTAPSEMLEVAGSVKATSFISTSDRRLKRDIASVDGLDAVSQMNGVTWNWKSDGTRDMGVIAQDVEKVFPWAVVTDPNTGFKAVKYNGLIAPLIESTKELYGMCRMADQRNDQQDRSIASLEDKAARLEAENRVKDLKIKTLEQKLDAIQAWVCAKDPSAAICQ